MDERGFIRREEALPRANDWALIGVVPALEVETVAVEDRADGGGMPSICAWGRDAIGIERLGDDGGRDPDEVLIDHAAENFALVRMARPVLQVAVVAATMQLPVAAVRGIRVPLCAQTRSSRTRRAAGQTGVLRAGSDRRTRPVPTRRGSGRRRAGREAARVLVACGRGDRGAKQSQFPPHSFRVVGVAVGMRVGHGLGRRRRLHRRTRSCSRGRAGRRGRCSRLAAARWRRARWCDSPRSAGRSGQLLLR